MTQKTAVIIGASSGIGLALARELHSRGYRLGLAARRTEILNSLAVQLDGAVVAAMDVTQPDQAADAFDALVRDLGGVDVVVISSGVGYLNKDLNFPQESHTIAVNVAGFTALATAAYRYFAAQKRPGHLVGLSSVAAVRGSGGTPAYNASKAFVVSYLEGLSQRAARRHPFITITDIRPGFIDTPMTRGQKGMFWLATPETAARQIAQAIEARKAVAYVPGRWRLVACLLKALPRWLYHKMG